LPATTLSAPTDALLTRHPATPCPVVTAIAVSVAATADGGLALRYRIHATPGGRLLLPPQQPSGPADGLWQHTCCEAFIAGQDDAAYREFNLSPSGQWAAYRFIAYRAADSGFVPPAAPQISLQPLADGFQLDARLAASLLPAGPCLHLGLSVVIEAADGSKSYWALAHGSTRPDFHLRQSFTLTLNRNTP
jgi:hypothetical protein